MQARRCSRTDRAFDTAAIIMNHNNHNTGHALLAGHQETAFCYHTASPEGDALIPIICFNIIGLTHHHLGAQPKPLHATKHRTPTHTINASTKQAPTQHVIQACYSRDHDCVALGLHSHHPQAHHVPAQRRKGNATHTPTVPVPADMTHITSQHNQHSTRVVSTSQSSRSLGRLRQALDDPDVLADHALAGAR